MVSSLVTPEGLPAWRKPAECEQATEPAPASVRRGSRCPAHGTPLFWLYDGNLVCEHGHGYRIPDARILARSEKLTAKTPGAT
jgi:hypothetical protein